MKPSEILKAARAKISNPRNWTTRYYARDAFAWMTGPRESDAVCFCAVGAVFAVTEEREGVHEALLALDRSAKAVHGVNSIVKVNDRMGHSAVMDVYNSAIRAAETAEVLRAR